VVTEAALNLPFEGLLVPDAYRLDLLVEDTVVLEVKAIDVLNAWHEAQLLTLNVRTKWGLRPCSFQIFQITKGLTSAASAIRRNDQCLASRGFSYVVILMISALRSTVITGLRPRPGAAFSLAHVSTRARCADKCV
jgi:hypothetical protein